MSTFNVNIPFSELLLEIIRYGWRGKQKALAIALECREATVSKWINVKPRGV